MRTARRWGVGAHLSERAGAHAGLREARELGDSGGEQGALVEPEAQLHDAALLALVAREQRFEADAAEVGALFE